ncbi:hypothetical protein [Streptomyces sp. XH2]|uniref:hypothetical protein n=1 Tax=Streptomyces sp. XH2 TaxID=3412483 RepID=UPI003C7A3AC1
MLKMFKQMNAPFEEVNMPARDDLYLLDDRDLLIRLMRRTGSGQRVTVRDLAERASVAVGTVGNLTSGAQQWVTYPTARAISNAIGVDLPILFVRSGRAVPASEAEATPLLRRTAV